MQQPRQKANPQIVTSAIQRMFRNELAITDILDDENLVMDLKGYNYSQLSKFFSQKNMKLLINYIIKVPIEDDKVTGHKYPFNASEILCSENGFFIDKFFEGKRNDPHEDSEKDQETTENTPNTQKADNDQEKELEKKGKEEDSSESATNYELINYLFTFLDTTEELNYVLAGYFSKVFVHIVNHRQDLTIKYLFETKKKFITLIIRHLSRRTIAECLYKILTCYISDYQDEKIKIDIINEVLDTFDSDDIEKVTNVCDFFNEIMINQRVYYLVNNSETTVKKLYEIVSSKFKLQSFKYTIHIMININEHIFRDLGIKSKDTSKQQEDTGDDTQSQSACLYYMSHLYNDETNLIKTSSMEKFNIKNSCIFKIIKDFFIALALDFASKEEEVLIYSSFERAMPALGMTKILEIEYARQTLEIFFYLYEQEFLKYEELNDIVLNFCKTGFLEASLQYFFKFPLNSLYQKQFEEMMKLLTSKNCPESLVKYLVLELKITDIIMQNSVDLNFHYNSGTMINSGLLATLIEVSELIATTTNELMINLLLENTKWNDYTDFFSSEVQKIFNTMIFYEKKRRASFEPMSLSRTCSFNLQPLETKEEISFSEDYVPVSCSLRESIRKFYKNYTEGKVVNSHHEIEITRVDRCGGIIFDTQGGNEENLETLNEGNQDNPEFYDNNYFKINLKIRELDFEIEDN